MDLRVLGVYGVQQLELELIVVVRLRAVRLGVRAEGQHAVVRQVHLGILGVRALQREEQPIFALRPVRERDPGGVAGDGGHRLDEQAARKHVALAEFLDGRVSHLRTRDESDDETTRPRRSGRPGKRLRRNVAPGCDRERISNGGLCGKIGSKSGVLALSSDAGTRARFRACVCACVWLFIRRARLRISLRRLRRVDSRRDRSLTHAPRTRLLPHPTVHHHRDVISLEQNPTDGFPRALLLVHLLRLIQHEVHVLVETLRGAERPEERSAAAATTNRRKKSRQKSASDVLP